MKNSEPQEINQLGKPSKTEYINQIRVFEQQLGYRLMGFNLDALDGLLIAAAVVIIWRLRSVFGQRTGHEGAVKPEFVETPVTKTTLEQPYKKALPKVWEGYAQANSDLAKGLENIQSGDPQFTAIEFLSGAAQALEIILEAIAKGDKKTLQPLLAKPVYDQFAPAIDQESKAGNKRDFKFVRVVSSTLKSAILQRQKATIVVDFSSEIIQATYNNQEILISGNPTEITEIHETWSFERDLNSSDPNWKLSATFDSTDSETR